MNRKEALEILGFSPSDNPSEYEIRKAYRKLALEYHPDKHSHESKDVQKQNEEKFKELGAAYNLLTDKGTEEVIKLTDKNLDEINSPGDLKFYLYMALLEEDIAFLKKLFSKFKSSKDGRFGDYINDNIYGYLALVFAVDEGGKIEIIKLLLENGANCNTQDKYGNTALYVACKSGYNEVVGLLLEHGAAPNIQDKYMGAPLRVASLQVHYKIVELLLKHGAGKESESLNEALLAAVECRKHWHEREKVVELLLKYGANPNASREYHTARVIERDSYLASNSVTGFIKIFFLPYGSNNKARKLMAEYGGVGRDYILFQAIFTCCCLIVASAALFSIASPWCYVPTAVFALAACFFIKNAVHAAFFAKTKEPSPEFAEVITEKVVNNVGLNAEDNSQETGNALA